MTNYDNTWGTESSHSATMRRPRSDEEFNLDTDFALSQYSCREACKCLDWVGKLADSYCKIGAGGQAEWKRANLDESRQISWIRMLFKQLRDYALSFNSMIGDPSRQIETSEPEFHHVRTIDEDLPECEGTCVRDGEITIFEGHLANHDWALVLRGCCSVVEAFVVPAGLLLGLTANTLSRSQFPAVITITLKDGHATLSGNAGVNFGPVEVDTSSVPEIARLLFSYFVETASN